VLFEWAAGGEDVSAEIAGSGDIVIHGNPSSRDSQVMGSGRIRFR
jgi:hypothetical protein